MNYIFKFKNLIYLKVIISFLIFITNLSLNNIFLYYCIYIILTWDIIFLTIKNVFNRKLDYYHLSILILSLLFLLNQYFDYMYYFLIINLLFDHIFFNISEEFNYKYSYKLFEYLILLVIILLLLNNFNIKTILLLLSMFNYFMLNKILNILYNMYIYLLRKNNIIINNFNIISIIPKIKNIIFSKSGVITLSKLNITKVSSLDDNLLKYLFIAEYNDNSKIARVIKSYKTYKIDPKNIKKYTKFASKGISLEYGKDKILVGSYHFIRENNIDIDKALYVGTIIYVAVNEQYMGYIVISDTIKRDLKDKINYLNKNKLYNITMLSSDNENVVGSICKNINILDYYSNLTLEEKEFWLYYLQNYYYGKTLYIGNPKTDKSLFLISNCSMSINYDKNKNSCADFYLRNDDFTKIADMISITKSFEMIKKVSIILFFILSIIINYFTNFIFLFNSIAIIIIFLINLFYLRKYDTK